MQIQDEKLYSLEETSIILSLSKQTLRNLDNDKKFKAYRTEGKHRRYRGIDIRNKIEEMKQ